LITLSIMKKSFLIIVLVAISTASLAQEGSVNKSGQDDAWFAKDSIKTEGGPTYTTFDPADYPLLGKEAPSFSLMALNNDSLSFPRKGKITLLNFWHVHCSVCFREIPELNLLAAQYPNIEIISIMPDDTTAIAKLIETRPDGYRLRREINHNRNIDYQIIPNAAFVAAAYALPDGGPYSIIIDSEGKVQHLSFGYRSPVTNDPPDKTLNYLHLKSLIDDVTSRQILSRD